MPKVKPCQWPNCTEYVSSPSPEAIPGGDVAQAIPRPQRKPQRSPAYCLHHQVTIQADRNRARHQRADQAIYDDVRWRGKNGTRNKALLRDSYMCQHCGATHDLQVDHIVPIEEGGAPFDLDNTQTLCKRCHDLKHRGVPAP